MDMENFEIDVSRSQKLPPLWALAGKSHCADCRAQLRPLLVLATESLYKANGENRDKAYGHRTNGRNGSHEEEK